MSHEFHQQDNSFCTGPMQGWTHVSTVDMHWLCSHPLLSARCLQVRPGSHHQCPPIRSYQGFPHGQNRVKVMPKCALNRLLMCNRSAAAGLPLQTHSRLSPSVLPLA